uniref:ComEC/Rec2-related protein n=1 Tax=Desulfovibrio sp. U5L TaxID=596152 RepID=I2Q3J7_9BACT
MTRSIPPLLPWQPCLLAYAAGILAVAYAVPAACALLLLILFPRPAPDRPSLACLVLAFGLGCGAGALALPAAPRDVPAWITAGGPVALSGTVASVDPRPEGRLSVTLTRVAVAAEGRDPAALPGDLALTIDRPAFRPIPGDVLSVTTRVRPTSGFSNPGTADFAFSRRLDGVFYRAFARGDRNQVALGTASGDALARRRETLRRMMVSALAPPPEADAPIRAGRAMVVALAFGDLSDFSPADLDLIRRASLSHTLALSGMNISYVAAMGLALAWLAGRLRPTLFLRLPRPYLALVLTAPLVVGYCWLGGYSPSLYRAAFMFAGGGLLLLFGRHTTLFDGLFLALAAMLAAMPLAAFDARLQLSALAVAGIGLFWPPFAAFCARSALKKPWRWVVLGGLGILWTSLCAEAAVMPVICRLFGDLNFNPWLNAPWLPLLGLLVTPLALIGLALLPVPFLAGPGTALLLAAAWCCEGLMRCLAFLDARHLLLTRAVLRPSWPEMLGCFGLLAALAVTLSGRRRPLAALLASLALLVGPTVWRAVEDAREQVVLTVLDVGQGQAVALTLPGGRRLLVDAGGLFGNFDVGRAVVGAFLTDGRPPRLSLALASHPHADHVKGFLSLLDRFAVGRFLDNGGIPEGALAAPMAAVLADRGIPHASLAAGDRLDLGHGLLLSVLHPGPNDDLSGNNGSLVLRLTWNGRGLAVIPGDAERPVLRRLAAANPDLAADVLVLPHHGSATGLAKRFHTAVAPKIAIASCGDGGRYPSPKVVDSLARLGCATYATNANGAVTVRFAGPAAAPVVEVMVEVMVGKEKDMPPAAGGDHPPRTP